MERRAVLGGVASACAVLVGGCLGDGRDGATTTEATTATSETTTEATTTTSDTTTTTERVTYESPTADDFAFNARVLDGSPEGGPPRVGVELTNVANHGVVASGGATLPFTQYSSTDGALALVPDDREHVFPVDGDTLIPESRDGCWALGANVAVDAIGFNRSLAPGESVSTKFSVLASSSDPCPGAGSYRFEKDVSDVTLSFTVERAEDGRITDASGSV